MSILRCYIVICLAGLKKITNDLIQDRRSPDRDCSPAECKTEVLLLEPTRSPYF
jgi:hypothetical protein